MICTTFKKILKLVFLFFCLNLFSLNLHATHIVGGELNYTYIGNDQYEIRLTLYRDCFNGIPPFDNPASVGIFDQFNNFVSELQIIFPGSDTIPPTINSPCFIPPTNICYEHTSYLGVVTLTPRLQGYQLSYQRCCRNNTIKNIIDPSSTGATYYATIPSAFLSENSNPVFKNWPPPFICAGIPFVFDHSATDADGDSITYELCTPFDGADTINPRPQPPNPPPYNDVTFIPPYNVNDMLGGIPLQVDKFTGKLTCTPNSIGQYVVGVCAREFKRNGTYISTTRRDFQLNVVPCPSYVVAAIQNPLINCKTNTVTFANFSLNAGSYLWNFGDTTTLADTSVAFSPTYIYPDTGVYTVTLIAYSSLSLTCADTTIGTVTILPEYTASINYARDICTNNYSFTDTSNSISGNTTSWFWDFNDGTISTSHNPVHKFLQSGTYTVTFYGTSSRGCTDTVAMTIIVPPLLNISLSSINPVRCFGECNGSITINAVDGNFPYQYLWNDPNNQLTATASNLCIGQYIVKVTDSQGCILIDSAEITQPDSLKLNLASTLAYCKGACIGTAIGSATGGNGGLIYQWNDPLLQQTSFATSLCPGIFTVLVSDNKGCTIKDSIAIFYSDSIPEIHATADTTILYSGQSTLLHAIPVIGFAFSWNPSISLNNSTLANPTATPTQTTTYTISVTDKNQCSNQDTVTIIVKETLCNEPEIFIPNAFTPNNDLQNDVLYIRGNTIEKMHISIYDRWGEKVFESSNKLNGWDGNYKGKVVLPGVFVYYLEIGCYNKVQFSKKGNITVIR